MVACSAAQTVDGVIVDVVGDVGRFPFSVFRFVVDRIAVDWGFLSFLQFQFDDDGIGGGARQ